MFTIIRFSLILLLFVIPTAFVILNWLLFLLCRYDMWSVGVVILELILGSPNVFQISTRTRVLLEPHIEGWNEELKELAYKLVFFHVLYIIVLSIISVCPANYLDVLFACSYCQWFKIMFVTKVWLYHF